MKSNRSAPNHSTSASLLFSLSQGLIPCPSLFWPDHPLGRLINSRQLFLQVLEVGGATGQGKAPLLSGRLLLCPPMVEGARELRGLFYKDTNPTHEGLVSL